MNMGNRLTLFAWRDVGRGGVDREGWDGVRGGERSGHQLWREGEEAHPRVERRVVSYDE